MSTFAESMEKVSSLSSDSQILRAQWHDYRAPGFYLITMVCNDRDATPFGSLTGDSEDTADIRLSAVGEALKAEIESQHERHPEIDIEEYVIMEDHCHLFIHVNTEMPDHLGKVVWGIKYGTTAAYLNALNARDGRIHRVEGTRLSQDKRNNGGNTADKLGISSTVRCGASTSDVILVPPLWQEGYHDRIVTRYGQIATQRTYIRRNAARLWLKRHSDRQLTRVRDLHLPLSLALAQRLKDTAIYWDQRRDVQHSQFSQRHVGAHYSETYVQLVQKFLRKRLMGNSGKTTDKQGYGQYSGGVSTTDSVEPFLRLRACGNVSLLTSGRPLVAVRISRSVTKELFLQELARILDLCEREGAIAISPFRSWSEKAVLTALRQNGYAHIIMHGESMWDGWKPQDGSTATHHQQVPEWFYGGNTADKQGWERDNNGGNTAGKQGDMSEVYAGRCLFLALWPDRPRGERATKADCEVMNEVCRVLGMREYPLATEH